MQKALFLDVTLVEDLQVVVKDTDSGMWEEGRISSSNDDGSITVTLAKGEKDRVIKDPTNERDDHGVLVQVSSLACNKKMKTLSKTTCAIKKKCIAAQTKKLYDLMVQMCCKGLV